MARCCEHACCEAGSVADCPLPGDDGIEGLQDKINSLKKGGEKFETACFKWAEKLDAAQAENNRLHEIIDGAIRVAEDHAKWVPSLNCPEGPQAQARSHIKATANLGRWLTQERDKKE